MTPRTLIIAEAGVNHDGDLEKALALIDAAAEAHADIVKFQTFSADRLVSRTAAKASYQLRATDADETQHSMLARLELSKSDHVNLLQRAQARGIEFLSSPFDLSSLATLIDLDLKRLKLGSGELTNAPLLVAAGQSGRPVILSTGMGTMADVERALAALATGYLGLPPSQATFATILQSDAAWKIVRAHVTLLHCTTQYPAPAEDANLAAITSMRGAFGLPVGYSDHCLGTNVAVAAVAVGATVIEKHFTLDKAAPGPDHAASLEPAELANLVQMIRDTERAMGDGIKRPQPSEIANIVVARKSVVAAAPITSGEPLTDECITTKRPGTGRSPFEYFDLVGTHATRDYATDDPV
jgi:N-acetylneuraminate synthase